MLDQLKPLDSRFHGNDGNWLSMIIYEFIKLTPFTFHRFGKIAPYRPTKHRPAQDRQEKVGRLQ